MAREPVLWCVALGVAVVAIAAAGYASRDPDSFVYASLASRLASQPLRSWIAPEWWGIWGNEGLFREHPIGILVLPALLARAGYPAEQSAYALGAVYSIAALLLLRRLTRCVASPVEATAAAWAALLLPVAFAYRIRANQEYLVLLLLLAALYATERSRRAPGWIAVSSLAAVSLLLVKGVFVIFAPVACGLWLLLAQDDSRGTARQWAGVALMVAAVGVAAAAYDMVYRAATGEGFWRVYVAERIGRNAWLANPERSIWWRVYNAGWYSGRLLWFGAPGSIALLAWAGWSRSRGDGRARGAARFSLALATAYVLLLSLGGNKADRFIFPAYFVVGTAGAIVAVRWSPRARRAAQRAAALEPYGTAAAWLALFFLTFLTSARLPHLRF